MFFERCIVSLAGFLPARWKRTEYFHSVYDSSEKEVIVWHKKVIERHQAQLEKLDPVFLLQRHNPDLISDWEEALARHPSILDFYKK